MNAYDLMSEQTRNGIRRGEMVLMCARNAGKSWVERELTLRMLKERQPALKADVFWLDDCGPRGTMSFEEYELWGYIFGGWDGKFRKNLSKEVLDTPDTIAVEWANFIQKEI